MYLSMRGDAMKRILMKSVAILLVVLQLFPLSLCAFAADGAEISVSRESGYAGDTVTVQISLSQNPGIVAMQLNVSYDSARLQLLSATDKKLFGNGVASFGNNIKRNPYSLIWDDSSVSADHTETGALAELTFSILPSCPAGEVPVNVTVVQAGTFNVDLDDVSVSVTGGSVTVLPASVTVLSAQGISAQQGTEIDIPVVLSDNVGLVALQTAVSYDSNQLTLTGVTDGELFGEENVTFGGNIGAVPYKMLWEDGITKTNHTENGTLVTLHFAVNPTACVGETVVQITAEAAYNVSLQSVEVVSQDVTVTLLESEKLVPTVLFSEIQTVTAGDTFTAEILLQNNPGIVSAMLSLQYDTNKLVLLSAENGNIFSLSAVVFSGNISAMPFRMLWEDGLNQGNITENGSLATLTFQAKETLQPGETVLSLSVAPHSVYNRDLQEISLLAQNASILADAPRLTAEKNKIYIGEQVQMAYSYPYQTVTPTDVQWDVDKPYLAQVDANGLLTATNVGYVTVTATDETGRSASCRIHILPNTPVIGIFSYGGDYEQKLNWWKPYSSASLCLGYHAYNCEEVVFFKWSSNNKKVQVDQNGVVTNSGRFCRKATITLTGYNADGQVVTSSDITVVFYKFNWQEKYLFPQSVRNDCVTQQSTTEQDTKRIQSELTLSERIFSILEYVLSVFFGNILK